MQKGLRLLAMAALLGFPGAVKAQTLGQVCQAVSSLGVGEWVEYEVSGGMTAGFNSLRYTKLGTEERNGTTHHRYEVKISGTQTMTSEYLIGGDGGPWNIDDVVEMTVQMPGQPPMTLTGDMIAMMQQNNQTPDIDKECEGAEVVGHESVTVPAGSWDTLHIRAEDGTDVWASLDVPMAVVKLVTAHGPTMELKGHGTGAGS